jgi:hypothetical protein
MVMSACGTPYTDYRKDLFCYAASIIIQTSPCLTLTLRLSKGKETNNDIRFCDRRLNHFYCANKKIGDIYKVTEL